MIRKTVKVLRRKRAIWGGGVASFEERIEDVRYETWWFLFIPVFSAELIINSN